MKILKKVAWSGLISFIGGCIGFALSYWVGASLITGTATMLGLAAINFGVIAIGIFIFLIFAVIVHAFFYDEYDCSKPAVKCEILDKNSKTVGLAGILYLSEIKGFMTDFKKKDRLVFFLKPIRMKLQLAIKNL